MKAQKQVCETKISYENLINKSIIHVLQCFYPIIQHI